MKKEENKDKPLEFNVTLKGKNEKAYSLFDKSKHKKTKKKDVVINAVKAKKSKGFIFIVLIVIILIAIIIISNITKTKVTETPVNNKPEEKENVTIVNDKKAENVVAKEEDITFDLEEGKKLLSHIKGTVIKQDYTNYDQISNKNKIKIVMSKSKLTEEFTNEDGEKVSGISKLDFMKNAKEIFSNDVEIDLVTIDRYIYDSVGEYYVVAPELFSGYTEVEVPIKCTKKDDLYTLTIAYAEGYVSANEYLVTTENGEEIDIEIKSDEANIDECMKTALKKHIDKLDHYEYQIKKDSKGNLEIVSFKKI